MSGPLFLARREEKAHLPRRPHNPAVTFWRHPRLPGLELRTSRIGVRAFREHFHATYSIGLIDDGATRSSVWGRPFRAARGQLVILEPYAVHACHPSPDGAFAYRMIFVEPDWFVGSRLSDPSFPEPVVDDPTLFLALNQLFATLVSAPDPGPLKPRVRATLSALAEAHGRTGGEPRRPPPAGFVSGEIERAVDAHQPCDVASLAATAGLSRAHFSRQFKAAVGLSPHAYLTLLRVEKAKRLLARGAPIAATALDVGFSDQSHFARTFRRFAGATPAQYQTASPSH